MEKIKCNQCGACCIALSISSAIPGMPHGKDAGVYCVNLDDSRHCKIYNARPSVCKAYSPSQWLCGNSFTDAMKNIAELEELTKP